MANKKFTTLEADPTTVITTPASGDFILIHDISEPLLAKQIKAIAYADLVKLATQSALQALITGQAAGDVFYADTATALAKLVKPSVDSVLKNTSAGVPSWKAIADLAVVTKRQGGSATDWNNSTAANNYTPAAHIIQCGAARIVITNPAQFNSVTVTFPQAFSYKPLVLTGGARAISGSYTMGEDGNVLVGEASTTQVSITLENASSGTSTWEIAWLAVGSI
jgi:hypothetical protein